LLNSDISDNSKSLIRDPLCYVDRGVIVKKRNAPASETAKPTVNELLKKETQFSNRRRDVDSGWGVCKNPRRVQ
jgi:hypothetical protein